MLRRGLFILPCALVAAACGGEPERADLADMGKTVVVRQPKFERMKVEVAPIQEDLIYYRTAFCTAQVEGIGDIDVENDYLPHVVACENGVAEFEALKAQAVAARTYLYHQLERKGFIGDGQHDQVYSCSIEPRPEHYQAVNATRGQVLTYDESTISAFYVAGAVPNNDGCFPERWDDDRFNTERFVTYNWGYGGDEVIQTPLGDIDEDRVANRGAQSQNGANCLAAIGVSYEDILRYYYGMDIVGDIATGACVDDAPTTFKVPGVN